MLMEGIGTTIIEGQAHIRRWEPIALIEAQTTVMVTISTKDMEHITVVLRIQVTRCLRMLWATALFTASSDAWTVWSTIPQQAYTSAWQTTSAKVALRTKRHFLQ